MGGIALAVELLAHAAHGERDLQDLAVRWHTERVRLLQRASADHRLLSIAVSLDTSWNSPLMTAPARRLLSLLGRLPDGIAIDHVAALLADEGAAAANTLRRRGLVIDDHPRLRTLPPLRHHLAYAHPPQDDDWQRATGHYCSLAETLADRAGRRGGNEALTALAKDSANITIALIDILTGPQPSTAYTAAQKLIGAASSNGADVSRVADALLAAAERARVLADNLLMLGMLDLLRSNHNAGRSAYERAQSLLEDVGDMRRLASCIQRLGDIALFEFDHDAARSAYQRRHRAARTDR
jgi:hypothetical protein